MQQGEKVQAMKPFRVRQARNVFVSAGLTLLGMLAAEHPLHAAEGEPLLRPTPLVLKDGRIANVSIHVVPFAPGRSELAPGPAGTLAELTRAVGTDCFLTAQVIGHIDSSEVAEDDTLNAHRLARARADAVQASLIGGGLPAKAIASVWDWQFMVPAPRATLWVFELTAGEDCEGRPLQADLVARAPSTEQQSAAPERTIARAVAPAERAEESAVEGPAAARDDAAPRAAAPSPARPQPQLGEVDQGGPNLTQPVPAEPQAIARTEATAGQRDQVAAVAATPKPQRPAVPPASDGKVEPGPNGDLIITFATNSSYFPSGATARLRELLAGIDGDRRYEVTVQVAVSGTTKVVGAKSAQEAARYNKWLAERRLERVQNWLIKNGATDAMSIKPEYVADDDSRRVTVRVAPVG
jgi:outer membrane protein OmpA-like peptidoglycan-associated protein